MNLRVGDHCNYWSGKGKGTGVLLAKKVTGVLLGV